MKKWNIKYLLLQIVLVLVIAAAIALAATIGLSFVIGDGSMDGFFRFFKFLLIVCWIVALIRFGLQVAWGGSNKLSEKTFDAGLDTYNFRDVSTFTSADSFLAIDGTDGRIAYVSNMNPKEFQIAEAKDLSNIRTGTQGGALGGVTMVYFVFEYKGVTTKVHTFMTNSSYSKTSEEVLEAISKADMYVDMLNRLKV